MPTIAPLPVKPVCLSCKKPESAQLMGSTYQGQGENGMRVKFWLCNPCAVPLGPSGQGPINMPESLKG
jgi:hypothetical protein